MASSTATAAVAFVMTLDRAERPDACNRLSDIMTQEVWEEFGDGMQAAIKEETARIAPTVQDFAEAARIAHEKEYAKSGSRYAEPEEMEMHRADPLAHYELVRAEVEAMPKFAGWRLYHGEVETAYIWF